MATYVPNPQDVTQPTEDKFVESAAAEFRALKTEVRDQIEDIEEEIEEIQNDIANIVGSNTPLSSAAIAELFSGDDVRTSFTLLRSPGKQANLDVSVSAAVQRPGLDYIWLGGTTLDFVVPPITGDKNILVRYTEGLPEDSDGSIRGDLGNPDLGDALVAVKQPFIDTVARTQHEKNLEIVSILDFGATGLDIAADTFAFQSAQASREFTFIPEGYVFRVLAGLDYWKFYGQGRVIEPTREWTLSAFPQVPVLGKHYVPRTYGTYETAAGHSVSVNSSSGQRIENTQVSGTDTRDTKGLAQSYSGRDHVGQFIGAYGYVPDVLDSTTSYTVNSLDNATVPGLNVAGKLKVGMVIDTLHATPCTGRITGINGSVISVDAWWPKVGAAPIAPASGTGAIINPNNKIFGQNIVVSSLGNGTTTGAQSFAGMEIDLHTPDSPTSIPGTWGIDMVTVGGFADVGYQIRGKRNISFSSNPAGGGGNYGFMSAGDKRGVSVQDAVNAAIEVITGGISKFFVAPTGEAKAVEFLTGATGRIRGGVTAQASTTPVNLGLPGVAPNFGHLIFVSGFNTSGGATFVHLLLIRVGAVIQIGGFDATGLTVAYSISGGSQAQIKTTSGTIQYDHMQILL